LTKSVASVLTFLRATFAIVTGRFLPRVASQARRDTRKTECIALQMRRDNGGHWSHTAISETAENGAPPQSGRNAPSRLGGFQPHTYANGKRFNGFQRSFNGFTSIGSESDRCEALQ